MSETWTSRARAAARAGEWSLCRLALHEQARAQDVSVESATDALSVMLLGERRIFRRLRNLTPHPVVIERDGVRVTLAPDPGPARVEAGPPRSVGALFDLGDIPVIEIIITERGSVTGLPPWELGTALLVSRLVAEAAPERDDLVVPDDLIRDDQGRVVAARRLAAVR